jgi:putative DNA primase/helicase
VTHPAPTRTELDVRSTHWLNAGRSVVNEKNAARLQSDIEEAVPPEFSDDALALAFTERYGATLRYTEAWGKWHEKDGPRWKEDTTLGAFDKVRRLCRERAGAAPGKRLPSLIASGRTVASVERLARFDRRHAATPDQWDADPWVLCTPAGVVDLSTGEIRGGKANDYITKITAVAPGGECPRFLEFLDWATGGDTELASFLQRVFGYGLTGSIREHALIFCYGTGGNGKGTLLNTVTGVMGDYAKVAAMEAFTEARGERHPTDLAMLRGARVVTSQETERGRRWAESRVKAITGGDPITARFMRQDFFTFLPEFKLIIAGNEKPSIDSVDEAIRRRFHLIPFEQQITAEKRDETLSEKLREEWSAILAWMIEGCLAWQEYGLRPPERVTAATLAYLTAEDSYAAWLEEACTTGTREWESSATLYGSWSTFAKRAGEEPGTRKGFAKELAKRGFTAARDASGNTRGFNGLSVRENTVNAYHTES